MNWMPVCAKISSRGTSENADLTTNEHYRESEEIDKHTVITATTMFYADVRPAAGNCTLLITHHPAGSGLGAGLRAQVVNWTRSLAESSVRIDGLSMWCRDARMSNMSV